MKCVAAILIQMLPPYWLFVSARLARAWRDSTWWSRRERLEQFPSRCGSFTTQYFSLLGASCASVLRDWRSQCLHKSMRRVAFIALLRVLWLEIPPLDVLAQVRAARDHVGDWGMPREDGLERRAWPCGAP